jgi:hypothetical protein
MRPRFPAMLLAPGRLGLRLAFCRCRRFFGRRSVQAVSSVASGRIEFASRPNLSRSSTDCPFPSSCSPHRVTAMQLLSSRGGKLRRRGTFTLQYMLFLKRTRFRRPAENCSGTRLLAQRPRPDPGETGWRDASRGDRDGRAPRSACVAAAEFLRRKTDYRTSLSHPLSITPKRIPPQSESLTNEGCCGLNSARETLPVHYIDSACDPLHRRR